MNIGCFSQNIGHFGPNIGRFDSTSAALTSATFDQTSAALAQHRPLSTVPWSLKFRFVWAVKNRKHVLLIRIKILSEAGSHGNADLGAGQRFDSSLMIHLVWLTVWRIRLFRLGLGFKLRNIFSRAPQHVVNVVQNQIANLKWDVLNQLQLVTGDQIY